MNTVRTIFAALLLLAISLITAKGLVSYQHFSAERDAVLAQMGNAQLAAVGADPSAKQYNDCAWIAQSSGGTDYCIPGDPHSQPDPVLAAQALQQVQESEGRRTAP